LQPPKMAANLPFDYLKEGFIICLSSILLSSPPFFSFFRVHTFSNRLDFFLGLLSIMQ
jgi:hypothetical protein